MFPVGKYSLLFLFAGTSKEVPAFIFSGDDLNMNTFEKRSRYFRELSLYLQRNGFTTQDNLDQMLSVEWKELPLCRITEGASVLYRQKDIKNPGAESALHQATDIACTVYEYMAILDQAPTLKADGLAEPYRLISEFNGTVLAAKESRYRPSRRSPFAFADASIDEKPPESYYQYQ